MPTNQLRRDAFQESGVVLMPGCQWMPHTTIQDKGAKDSTGGIPRLNIDFARMGAVADSAVTINNYGGTPLTAPNIGLPVNYLNYIDPNIIQVQFSAMNASKLFVNRKVGDWTQEYTTFPVEELVGNVGPYSDFTNNLTSDVNYSWPSRQIYKYQTGFQYGTFEMERSAVAQIQLASRRQAAATTVMAKAENSIYLRGVKGVKLYGLLNDPNIAAPISPASVTTSQGANKTAWKDKALDAIAGANLIYNDIMALFQELTNKNGGHVDRNSTMTLALSHVVAPYLTTANHNNVTVLGLLKNTIPNLNMVIVPELSLEEGERLYMICPEINGQPVGMNAFADKIRMWPVIQHMGFYEQKISAATWGCVITQPSLIACMSGI